MKGLRQTSLLATLREIGYRGPVGLMCFGIAGDPRQFPGVPSKTFGAIFTRPHLPPGGDRPADSTTQAGGIVWSGSQGSGRTQTRPDSLGRPRLLCREEGRVFPGCRSHRATAWVNSGGAVPLVTRTTCGAVCTGPCSGGPCRAASRTAPGPSSCPRSPPPLATGDGRVQQVPLG